MGDEVGDSHVTVIAEAGVNHNGDLALALELIDAAAAAGADLVKFQTFTAADIVLPSAPKADYQRRTTPVSESQFEMLRQLELSHDAHHTLLSHARERGIGFLSTPFDRPSLRFLIDDLGLNLVKLPSSDLTNTPLLIDAARSGAALILSTGMGTLGEVEHALKALAFGLAREGIPYDTESLDEAYADPDSRVLLRDTVTLLHCTSDYPAAVDSVNLRAMATLSTAFAVPVGYSDHTQGITVAVAAAALGAVVIEKHLTLDNAMPGPDHAASSEPDEFAALVRGIRDVERALGSQAKVPGSAELVNRRTMRKGMYAARDVAAGTVLTEGDILVVRPATPVGPEAYFAWLGAVVTRDLRAGDPLVADRQE